MAERWVGYFLTKRYRKLVPIALVEASAEEDAKHRVADARRGCNVIFKEEPREIWRRAMKILEGLIADQRT
ncbi:MAG: hypothetical protein AAB360_01350 [Patescibacteria group bacterium]